MGEDEGVLEEEIEGEEGEEGGKLFGSTITKILTYLIQIVIVIIISFVVTQIVTSCQAEQIKEKESPTRWQVKETELSYFDLDPFKVNTADKEEAHFISVKMSLAYPKNDVRLVTELNSKKKIIRDFIIEVLIGKRFEDLTGPENKKKLQDELVRGINKMLRKGKIERITFSEYTIM